MSKISDTDTFLPGIDTAACIATGLCLILLISLIEELNSVLCVLLPQVKRTYSQGTYRAGAMRQVSLVGAVDEEVGDYFPEFISMLEESPFLEVCMNITVFLVMCVCICDHSQWMC